MCEEVGTSSLMTADWCLGMAIPVVATTAAVVAGHVAGPAPNPPSSTWFD